MPRVNDFTSNAATKKPIPDLADSSVPLHRLKTPSRAKAKAAKAVMEKVGMGQIRQAMAKAGTAQVTVKTTARRTAAGMVKVVTARATDKVGAAMVATVLQAKTAMVKAAAIGAAVLLLHLDKEAPQHGRSNA